MTRWLLLLSLFAVSCDFGTASLAGVDNRCGESADCLEGVCEEGICVQSTVAPFSAIIEVTRATDDDAGSAPQSWAFTEQTIAGSTTRDLQLPRTVLVSGAVRWQDSQVPARLTFVRRGESEVLVAPLPVQTLTLAGEARGGDESPSMDYVVRLVDGATYELVVEPSSDMLQLIPAFTLLPPLRFPIVPILGDNLGHALQDVVYDPNLSSPCTEDQSIGCKLVGRILFSTATEENRPQAGLVVRAVEVASGRVVSSTSTTNDDGEFEIRISPSAAAYGLRINSTADGSLFPVITVPPDALGSPAEPVQLEFGQPEPVSFGAIVVGSDGLSVPNASVQLTTDAAIGSSSVGKFSLTATTDDEGRFTSTLLPGLYRVLITPTQDDQRPLGVLLEEISIIADTEDREFALPEPLSFVGTVTSFDGSPVSGVTVQARPRTTAGSNLATSRSRDVVTDRDGAFRTDLDKGSFDLTVKPSPESGFAWVLESTVVFAEPQVRDWRLGPPVSIRGTITAGDGAPAAGVTVRLYVPIDAEEGGQRPVVAAQTITDESGAYRLLVTPR